MIFHALGFPEISLLGLGFGQKSGWEIGFGQNLGWEMGFIPPPPLQDPLFTLKTQTISFQAAIPFHCIVWPLLEKKKTVHMPMNTTRSNA